MKHLESAVLAVAESPDSMLDNILNILRNSSNEHYENLNKLNCIYERIFGDTAKQEEYKKLEPLGYLGLIESQLGMIHHCNRNMKAVLQNFEIDLSKIEEEPTSEVKDRITNIEIDLKHMNDKLLIMVNETKIYIHTLTGEEIEFPVRSIEETPGLLGRIQMESIRFLNLVHNISTLITAGFMKIAII